jgi:hypothetical protein
MAALRRSEPRVHRQRAGRADDHGIDLDLDEVGSIHQKSSDATDQPVQARVARRAHPGRVEYRPAMRSERPVDADDRLAVLVAPGRQEQLRARGGHGLNEHAVDHGGGVRGGDAAEHGAGGAAHRGAVRETEHNSAGLRLVGDIRRHDLERDRETDRRGGGDRLIRAPGEPGRGAGDEQRHQLGHPEPIGSIGGRVVRERHDDLHGLLPVVAPYAVRGTLEPCSSVGPRARGS